MEGNDYSERHEYGPVNAKKISCFAWLIVFLALAVASGWFVGRRIPEAEAALRILIISPTG